MNYSEYDTHFPPIIRGKEKEEEKMDLDGPELWESIDKPYFTTTKTYPPPPDGLISSQILPDRSNSIVASTSLSSGEIHVSDDILHSLQPGERKVVYSGNLTVLPGR